LGAYPGALALPPENNVEQTGKQMSRADISDSELDSIRRKLEGLYENLEERGHLITEQVNPNSQNLDQLSSLELVDLFNREDAVAIAAAAALAGAIDCTAEALRHGGRLFYVGRERVARCVGCG